MTKFKFLFAIAVILFSFGITSSAQAYTYRCKNNVCITSYVANGTTECQKYGACKGHTDGKPLYGAIGQKGTASEDCTVLTVRLAEVNICPLCPLFRVILKTDQTMATKSYAALAKPFLNVVVVLMALYVAFQTLLTVSSFTKQDAPKYITTLLVQAFKVLVVFILLSDSTHIYHYVVEPLMKGGLEFGLALLFNESALSKFSSYRTEAASAFSDGVIDKELLGSIIAAVKIFTEEAASLPAIGSALVCTSTHAASLKGILPHVPMLIEGIIVYAFGWAIVLTASFYLLDSAVRFGIFCALIPFLIAAWPFKVTRSYTKTGWDIFINCVFNFIMMGLIISLITELISQALGGTSDELEKAINGDSVEDLKEMMQLGGIQLLILIACCMFAFKLVGQINGLASEISGTSGGESIGAKIGGAAAQVAKKAGGMAVSGGQAAGKFAADAFGLTQSIDNKKAAVAGSLSKFGSKLGLGKNANPAGAGGASAGSGGSGAGGGAGGAGGGSGAGGAGGSGSADGGIGGGTPAGDNDSEED